MADSEAAVREVAQAYELIKLQQPLLLLHCSSSSSATTQLAQTLLSKALRALNVALSVMKQQPAAPAGGAPVLTPTVKAEPQLSASADSQAMAAPRGAKRRRSSSSSATTEAGTKKKTSSPSWVSFTTVPYDDGYEWRKYGEKKINGTLFTRSYFRCTYRDDAGCQATKHVQQKDDGDPPTFQVIYNNDHTCTAKSNTITSSSSNNLTALLAGCCNSSGAAAAAMDIKQEPPLQLPPLAEIEPSAVPYYDQMPQQCQETPFFLTSMERQFCGALPDSCSDLPSSAIGSCVSGETWDGYSGDMAAQMAGHDPLHDIEIFLMCDSFKDY